MGISPPFLKMWLSQWLWKDRISAAPFDRWESRGPGRIPGLLDVQGLACGFLAVLACLPHAPYSGLGKGFALCPLPSPPGLCQALYMDPPMVQGQGERGVLSGTCLNNEDPREVWREPIKPRRRVCCYWNIFPWGKVNHTHQLPSLCLRLPGDTQTSVPGEFMFLQMSRVQWRHVCREMCKGEQPLLTLPTLASPRVCRTNPRALVTSRSKLDSAGLQVLLGQLSLVAGVVLTFLLLGVAGRGFWFSGSKEFHNQGSGDLVLAQVGSGFWVAGDPWKSCIFLTVPCLGPSMRRIQRGEWGLSRLF